MARTKGALGKRTLAKVVKKESGEKENVHISDTEKVHVLNWLKIGQNRSIIGNDYY
jgi:hypothetical protein